MGWFSQGVGWVSSGVRAAYDAAASASSVAWQKWKEKPLTQLWRSAYTLATTASIALVELGMVELLFREAACDVRASVEPEGSAISPRFDSYITPASYVAISTCMALFIFPRILNNWEKSDPKKLVEMFSSGSNDAIERSGSLSYSKKTFVIISWVAFILSFLSARIKNFEATGNAVDVFIPVNESSVIPMSSAVTILLGISSGLFYWPEFISGLNATLKNPRHLVSNLQNDVVAVCAGLQSAVWVGKFLTRFSVASQYQILAKVISAVSTMLVSLLNTNDSSKKVWANLARAGREHKVLLSFFSLYFLVWSGLNTFLLKESIIELSFPHMPHQPSNSTSLADTCDAISVNAAEHEIEQRIVYGLALPLGINFSFVFGGFLLNKWMKLIDQLQGSPGLGERRPLLDRNHNPTEEDEQSLLAVVVAGKRDINQASGSYALFNTRSDNKRPYGSLSNDPDADEVLRKKQRCF